MAYIFKCHFIHFLLAKYTREKDIYEILKIFVFAQVFTSIYILINLDLSVLGQDRIGVSNLGEGWIANGIGMSMAFAVISIFCLITYVKKRYIKVFYIGLTLVFSYISLLTESRKAFFILVFAVGLFFVLNSKSLNKKIVKMIITFLAGSLFIYIVISIPSLYAVLGSRIENLLIQLSGEEIVENSFNLRQTMVEYGIYFWKEQPLFGYGIDNFRTLFGAVTGMELYSHNNYIELMVGVGFLGVTIYYMGVFYIIKQTINKSHILLIFSFTTMLVILISDIGLVSYKTFYIQLFICLAFSSVRILNNKKVLK